MEANNDLGGGYETDRTAGLLTGSDRLYEYT